MLMMIVLTILREAYRSESLIVERRMVAAAKIAVTPEDQLRVECSRKIGLRGFSYIAGELAGCGVILATKALQQPEVRICGSVGDTFGEDTHLILVLQRVAWRGVSAHDVVIQHSFDVPALLFRHFGEVTAAVQALLFASDSEKDDGC